MKQFQTSLSLITKHSRNALRISEVSFQETEPKTYLGWKILAYRYYHSTLELQIPISQEKLYATIRDLFREQDWAISPQNKTLQLTHIPTRFEVETEVHGEEIEIEYDEGPEQETYLCTFLSHCDFAYKRNESQHKRLMFQVLKKLPWEEKAGGWLDGGRIWLVYSTNIEKGFEPFPVTPKRRPDCPIPEKLEPRRMRLLRPRPPTSYLGTRITTPKKKLVRSAGISKVTDKK